MKTHFVFAASVHRNSNPQIYVTQSRSKKGLKMKHQISIAVLMVITASSFKGTAQPVQYVTLYSGTNSVGVEYPVQTNSLVSLVGYDWYDVPTVSGSLPDGTSIHLTPQYRGFVAGGGVAFSAVPTPQLVTGLTNVVVQPAEFSRAAGWVTLQITPAGGAKAGSDGTPRGPKGSKPDHAPQPNPHAALPADAMVMPSSATGNITVVVESSTDLLNWTAANPGTYRASSATNRFFRVRAVHD